MSSKVDKPELRSVSHKNPKQLSQSPKLGQIRTEEEFPLDGLPDKG